MMYCWSEQGEKLSSTLELAEEMLDADTVVCQYSAFIEQWVAVKHPIFFTLDTVSIYKERELNKYLINCEVSVSNMSFFLSPSQGISNLPIFNRLLILEQVININELLHEKGMNISWDLSMLCIAKSGKFVFLLPQTPGLWLNKQGQGCKASRISIVSMLFDLFNLPYDLETNFIEKTLRLEKEEKIPWGWSLFIKDYLNNTVYNSTLFSAVFYKIWVYRTANHLAMTDKALNSNEYETLHNLGRKLDLSEKQMECLDIISQKYIHQTSSVSWVEDFLTD